MSQNAVLNFRRDGGEETFYGLDLAAWLKIAIVTALMIATFRFNLLRLWLKTNPYSGEPNWRHAVCVPLISLYFLYVNRDDLLKAPVRNSWTGLGILIAGILLFTYGIWPGQNDFIKDFGMIVTLFGVVAMLCGWRVMKIAWFPIVFLICAIPWPDLVYSYVASPLQHLAASVAVGTLRFTNIDAVNSGTKIIVMGKSGPRALNVAEACAGLRSLMTFISIGGAVAFLSTRPLWQKFLVTASAIPIAIFCNVMRVTGMGYIDQWKPEFTEGFAHQFVGMVMLVPGFLLIMLVGIVLDQLFIEEADERLVKNKNVIKASKPGVPAANWALPRTEAAEAKAKAPVAHPVTKPAAVVQAKAPVVAPTAVAAMPRSQIPGNSVAGIAKPVTKPISVSPKPRVVSKPPIAKPVTKAPAAASASTVKQVAKPQAPIAVPKATAPPVSPEGA